MRYLLLVIALILWFVLGYFIRPCFNSTFGCGDDSEKAALIEDKKEKAVSNIATSTAVATGPLLFGWNKAEAITGEGWEAKRQSLIDGLKEGEILEITGEYRADEQNTSTFANLGEARANEIAKLFKPPLTDEQIRLRGVLVKEADTDKSTLFKSAAFRNLKNTESIKEIDDRTLIYFPYSSTNKLNSSEVEAYLNDVADRVKKTGERVRLTGHTDSMSSKESNQRLGQRRADIVKNYLIQQGVPASKIIATSKGEMEPADGPYVDNKKSAKNRRTELQIIK